MRGAIFATLLLSLSGCSSDSARGLCLARSGGLFCAVRSSCCNRCATANEGDPCTAGEICAFGEANSTTLQCAGDGLWHALSTDLGVPDLASPVDGSND